MLLDVPDPVLDVVKTLLVGNIVDEHDAHCPAVVGCGDGPEPLLPCRVPDLQFDKILLVHNHAKVAELSSDRDLLLFKPLCRQSIENAGLSDSCVTYDHNLKELIILIHYALKV